MKKNRFFKNFNILKTMEVYMLSVSIILALIVIAYTVYVCLMAKPAPSNFFWQNYWTGMPIFITLIIALASVYFQIRMENKKRTQEAYLKSQYDIERDIFPRFTIFSDDFSSSNSELINNLSLFSVTIYQLKLSQKNDKIIFSEDKGDYLKDLESKVSEIVNNKKYEIIVSIVSNAAPIFSEVLGSLKKEYSNTSVKENNQNAFLHIIDENEHTINTDYDKNICNLDQQILGYWIMKYSSARNAKFLIGVATKDKRVVGAYKLHKSARKPDENKRIYFDVQSSDRLYLETSESTEKPFPHLENWTAQNPVLYYLDYINWKYGENALNPDQKEYIADLLKISIDDFNRLSGRDIIVVRTYKFDS
ncbi:hypothetical protein KII92_04330 [Leuconostoc gelidum subsp. gasicomitatum]|uniref:hypothetical protein n=1 Tax=Leuconostoc gasicomitatum TaxID=115778 RepID=UPI001CC81837|nr:hypothetical protein [Leuconostoc gasicomitatum]MBZ5944178.1 hypothetical protein [Leuconostoc gasicomitatum]